MQSQADTTAALKGKVRKVWQRETAKAKQAMQKRTMSKLQKIVDALDNYMNEFSATDLTDKAAEKMQDVAWGADGYNSDNEAEIDGVVDECKEALENDVENWHAELCEKLTECQSAIESYKDEIEFLN